MTKMIRAYLFSISLALEADGADYAALQQDLLTHLGFFQHKRLVHLLITLAFAVMLVASFLLPWDLSFILVRAALLALTAAYVGHYFFLENSVQRMYRISDAIRVLENEKKCGGC